MLILTILISRRGTVLDLKEAIQKQTGLEPEVQKIIFGGKSGNDSVRGYPVSTLYLFSWLELS